MHAEPMRWVALAVVLLLPGCMVRAPDGPGDTEPAGDRAAWLTESMAFSPRAPDGGAVRTGGFFESWASGDDYPTWRSDPMGEDVVVENLTVTLVLRAANGPVVESYRFPDIMVYGGGGESWIGFASTSDETVFLPTDGAKTLVFELAPPEGGLWVPAGESLGVKVVPVMLQQDDVADLEVLLGAEASRVEWSQHPLASAPRPDAIERTEGEVVGSAYSPVAAPTTSARVPVNVPAGAALVAWMNTTDHQGIPDIDFSLEPRGGGEAIAFSGTPTPREHLKLHPGNVPPGDYDLVVTSYGSARATFVVEHAVG